MSDFDLAVGDDGVAVITWDVEGRSMNVLTQNGIGELEECVDRVLSDDAIKGAVLTSGKRDFAGGMDLNVLGNAARLGGENPARSMFELVMGFHRMLRKIERGGMDPKTLKGGKPIVAALPGLALGIGFEIPLACHRIFAADNPKAKIGLPEIKVGLFPGAGGTTRLVRKMGAMAAAPYLLEGKLLDPKRAKSAGLIDEVVAPDALLETAKAWGLNASDADIVKPWDQKGYKMPGGAPYHPAGFPTYVGASAMVSGRTKMVYPAAQALLSAAYEGAMVPFDTALRIEARWFAYIVAEPTSSAMIRSLFVNKEALEKGARRPEAPDQKVSKLGVLGAGMMGAGIAHVAAAAGIDVVLLDQSIEAANKGKAHSEALLDKDVSRKRKTAEDKDAILSRITPSADVADLAGADLIVEAVFEDLSVKAEITKKVEAVIGDDCIFASNTSTLPISELAKASTRPDQFIGIHFFSPVDKMLLVEIIRGEKTGDRAVAKALDFVRQLRKTPIVVNDARFFYANRCILPYGGEGLRMAAEGVAPALIENAAVMLGFPLGPLQLIDEVSITLNASIARATKAAMGDAYPDDDIDAVVFWLEEIGRFGRKAKAGLYSYDEAGKRNGLWDGFAEKFPPLEDQPDVTEVQHRMMLAQVLEALRAYEAGVLTDVREGDVAAILGWGFAPWSGGPFSWVDRMGAETVLAMAEDLTARHGKRFTPPQLLRDMAASGAKFYDGMNPAAAA